MKDTPSSPSFNRILVIRTDRIGDLILTLPMLEILRQNFPRAHIAILVRHYTRELVEGDSNIDEVLLYDDGDKPVPFSRMVLTLRRQSFDVAFVTYPRFRLARLMYRARIPLRVGTGYRWYSFLFNRRLRVHRKHAERHEAEYNVDLLKAVGCKVPAIPFPRLTVADRVVQGIRSRFAELGISHDAALAIIHPGSGGSAREWSPQRFGELGKRLTELGNLQVVVTGGKGEETLVQHVAGLVGTNTPAVVNRLSLLEYAALAKLSAVLVANSTGPIHIAAAVGTPVVGIYPQVPPMSPSRWGPYTSRKIVFVPHGRPANCRVCVGKTRCECMDTISVGEVFAGAKRFVMTGQLFQPR